MRSGPWVVEFGMFLLNPRDMTQWDRFWAVTKVPSQQKPTLVCIVEWILKRVQVV